MVTEPIGQRRAPFCVARVEAAKVGFQIAHTTERAWRGRWATLTDVPRGSTVTRRGLPPLGPVPVNEPWP